MSSHAESNRKSVLNKKKKKSKNKSLEIFKIPGVIKMILSEEAQRAIFCVVGDDVTTEEPWKYVPKSDILDDIEINEFNSEFFNMKKLFVDNVQDNILIWYMADESKDYEEFAICTTPESEMKVRQIIQKRQDLQQARLLNSVMKTVKAWFGLGSEKEMISLIHFNNRPLIEIEVEGGYPIRTSAPIRFRLRLVEDARDGYIELRSPPEEMFSFISKRRIDNHAQIAPLLQASEVQTIGSNFMQNEFTQYNLDHFENTPITQKLISDMKKFNLENMEQLDEFFMLNVNLDLYREEYKSLIRSDNAIVNFKNYRFGEHMNILDVQQFTGKMVSHLTWHHMWSGVIAVAYVSIAPIIYQTNSIPGDEVDDIVHGQHCVAVYCCNDCVTPKLICISPREVIKISFCPFDENLLIGGLRNGQLILWDITNKLETVEAPNILSQKQKIYKKFIWSMIHWMKNVYDPKMVRPAALSDPRFSHKTCVTSLNFIQPSHTYTILGKLEETGGGYNSYQLITTSKDSAILVWDLLQKPKFLSGGFKPRRFRRLEKKPSSLISDESPYKILHLNMKPIYRISLPAYFKCTSILSATTSTDMDIKYTAKSDTKMKSRNFDERIYYNYIVNRAPLKPMQVFLGTGEGEHIGLTWNGKDFNSGEAVNSEAGTIINSGPVLHDGPILKVSYSQSLQVVLTIGGTIFALWHTDFKEGPILWRRVTETLLWCSWDAISQTMCNMLTESGRMYSWSLFRDSQKAFFMEQVGNCSITVNQIHPRPQDIPGYAMADEKGFVRIFLFPWKSPLSHEYEISKMKAFIENEMSAKRAFINWEKEWNSRNAVVIEEKKTATEDQTNVVTEVQEVIQEESGKKIELPMAERMKIYWAKMEKERIGEQIRKRKQTDTKKLEKLRKPLQMVEQENANKKLKLKIKHSEAQKFFKETVKIYFPNYCKKVVDDVVDPYAEKYTDNQKYQNYSDFKDISSKAVNFIDSHPYKYQFSWSKLINNMRKMRVDSRPQKRKSNLSFVGTESDIVLSSSSSLTETVEVE